MSFIEMATRKRRILAVDDEGGFLELLKMNLEKTRRYESASDLAADIRRYLDDETSAAAAVPANASTQAKARMDFRIFIGSPPVGDTDYPGV